MEDLTFDDFAQYGEKLTDNDGIPESITKRVLWRYVNQQLLGKIHHYHIYSVMETVFEEIINDLIEGKNVEVYNFGVFSLTRVQYKIFSKKANALIDCWRSKYMKLILVSKIKNRIKKQLDLDATFLKY